MLAELISGTIAASLPHPSPRSQLKSICGKRCRTQGCAGAGSADDVAGADAVDVDAGAGAALVDVAAGAVPVDAAVHSLASGLPPSICARTSGIGGPP